MIGLLKLLVFGLVLIFVATAAWYCYRKLNARIIASEKMGSLLLYTFLLIAANIVLLFGGIFLLVKLYELFVTGN